MYIRGKASGRQRDGPDGVQGTGTGDKDGVSNKRLAGVLQAPDAEEAAGGCGQSEEGYGEEEGAKAQREKKEGQKGEVHEQTWGSQEETWNPIQVAEVPEEDG
ncbi:hypothetical protein J6590_003705 [Homalodisca vitripennis]|nr:hypothetical protein J6590_003705 [Homalodisca vitripennis]